MPRAHAQRVEQARYWKWSSSHKTVGNYATCTVAIESAG